MIPPIIPERVPLDALFDGVRPWDHPRDVGVSWHLADGKPLRRSGPAAVGGYIQTRGAAARFGKPNARLLDALRRSMLALEYDTVHFEVVGDLLYAKYGTIIGSRCIARLVTSSFDEERRQRTYRGEKCTDPDHGLPYLLGRQWVQSAPHRMMWCTEHFDYYPVGREPRHCHQVFHRTGLDPCSWADLPVDARRQILRVVCPD